jgi:hypothetical protein
MNLESAAERDPGEGLRLIEPAYPAPTLSRWERELTIDVASLAEQGGDQ